MMNRLAEYRKLSNYEYEELKNILVPLQSPIRRRELCKRREYIATYLHYQQNLPLTLIGKLFNRHHTSIMNSIDNYTFSVDHYPNYYIDTEDYLIKIINEIKNVLTNKIYNE